ncbi:Rh157.6 [macacine betaherpesvirus 3]|nr:Rh157.6 [macacine betaherpesvirus 3]
MDACRVFITVTVCVLFCAVTVQGGICSVDFGNSYRTHRPDGYWDICSPRIPDDRRNKILERIINATVSYHYATSHSHDDVSLLKQINVTDFTYLVNSIQVRPNQVHESLNRELSGPDPKNSNKPLEKIGLEHYLGYQQLITFAASGTHTAQSRILTVAIRLPLEKLPKQQ